jgi:hypothetical protein
MDNTTALGSEVLEVEQFLRTPDAYRVLNCERIDQKGNERQNRAAAPTYDRVIEAVLAGDEPLEVVTRPLGWIWATMDGDAKKLSASCCLYFHQ